MNQAAKLVHIKLYVQSVLMATFLKTRMRWYFVLPVPQIAVIVPKKMAVRYVKQNII